MTETSNQTQRPHSKTSRDYAGASQRKVEFLATNSLIPDAANPRKHSRAQIRDIAKSVKAFGFANPVLIDRDRKILAGHGRLEAAKLLGLTEIPVIFLDHLTEAQAKAFSLAENRLHDRSTFDDFKVAIQLKDLSALDLDFDIEATGFESPEIEFRIGSLDTSDTSDVADEFDSPMGPPISRAGDLWLLGAHRLYCGNALDANSFAILMENEKAAAVFTDPPYNQKINGHVSGKGRKKFREFAMASGEMSKQQFADFLATSLKLMRDNAAPGAVIYACIDAPHIGEMLAAGESAGCTFLALCVWIKSRSGMGSFYRSRIEHVFVWKSGTHPHNNRVMLGKFGRNRSNAWFYPATNNFARRGAENNEHPTVKPVRLVADAIADCSERGAVILDPFVGSGTTILAAERTGRRGFGMELDPAYCDLVITRWEKMTGQQARNADGQTFAQVKLQRRGDQ